MEDLTYCVRYLAEERFGAKKARETASSLEGDERGLFEAYRALANVREPMPAADERLSLWRGDIATLAADVVVNAANSRMLGCWVPGHHCIDNAIHTYAGIQLRAECARIMQAQGRPEPTGLAKMTGAYNLPAKWVVHTVGPIADGNPDDEDRALLASCYESCLDAARETGAESIAFCCIGTGVFGFPQKEAAEIAVRTVRRWLDGNGPGIHVVFDVFLESDERIYRDVLFG